MFGGPTNKCAALIKFLIFIYFHNKVYFSIFIYCVVGNEIIWVAISKEESHMGQHMVWGYRYVHDATDTYSFIPDGIQIHTTKQLLIVLLARHALLLFYSKNNMLPACQLLSLLFLPSMPFILTSSAFLIYVSKSSCYYCGSSLIGYNSIYVCV